MSKTTTIPGETLQAMLKVKRQTKRRNMIKDDWIKKSEKAEMRVKTLEVENAELVAKNEADVRMFQFTVFAASIFSAVAGVAIGYLAKFI